MNSSHGGTCPLMPRRRPLVFASLLLVLCLSLPAAAMGREITGELVVLKTGQRQFRIVDHGGSFTAPAGIALEDFDGKPVRVELGSNNQVLSITEKPIETNPLMRHYQIVTGQLVVSDAVTGTFTINGDGRPFVAPPGFDLRPFANQMVDVFLDENGRVKSIDRMKSSALPAGYVPPPRPSGACAYDGQAYSDGVFMCQSGTRFRCETGVWRNVGGPCEAASDLPCNRDGASYADGSTHCDRGTKLMCDDGVWRDLGTACGADVTAAARSRSCVVGDATVSAGSTICRGGVMYRCADTQWASLGSACR